MPGPDPVENAFVTRAAAITGIRKALDYEPAQLPPMPAVALHFIGGDQDDRYTGPSTENEWTWRIRLYVPLRSRSGSEFQRAQNDLKTYVPLLLKIVRDDPSLGGTCSWARVLDFGEEPDYDTDQKRVTKDLVLRARTEET